MIGILNLNQRLLTCNPKIELLQTLPLEIQVKEFIKITTESKCCKSYGICGEQFKGDIFYGKDGSIEASRFRFQHIALTNQSVYIDSLVQTKKVIKEYSDKLSTVKGRDTSFEVNGKMVQVETAFPYSLFYVYYDQYLYIRAIAVENVVIALLAIFVAVQLIMNIKSALVVFFI